MFLSSQRRKLIKSFRVSDCSGNPFIFLW